jgi:hypothetical protein
MPKNIVITDNYTWTNEHNNVIRKVFRRYQISNGAATGWKEGLAGIQTMLKEARARNERVRSYGGKWSLTDVGICNDSIHDTKPLTFFGTVGKNSIKGSALFRDDPKPLDQRLYYFQCGSQVNQINNVLESRGLCLATTGASNGQTIAGAVSTGTHGSALRIGAMPDYVRAMHIVTSEKEHFFLQPAANPIITKSFSDIFGATLINDDSLFNSALVSFGSFGIIHGIVLETVSLFMLETFCIRTDYDRAATVYPYLAKFNHALTNNLSQFLKQFGFPSNEDPYHVDIIANQFSTSQNAFLRVMYKRPYDKTKLSPEPGTSGTRVGDDILSIVGSITNTAGGLASVIVNQLFGQAGTVQSGYTQTPRNIFGDSTIYKPKNGGASTELGVPIDKAADAVRRIMTVAQQKNFVGLLGIRFVKNSAATLAFTRFAPLTCTIELPGLNSDNTQNFFRSVFEEMDNAKIPFTLHWGQEGDYSPKRLSAMYGSAVTTWVNDRNRLLPDPMQRYMFTNDFLKRCGLSEAPALKGGNVIAKKKVVA